MADLEQGIKYTIEADATKAEKAVEDVGKSAAENGQKIQKAMAGASAVTSALNGNFVGAVASLGRMTKAVSGLGKMIAGATGWVAIIGAVVGVFHKWREKIAETKAKMEEFKQARFDEHIANMKKAQEDLAKEIDKTVAAIDRQLDADTRALDIAKEKIKAQIELNRQKDLEGKSDEEKEKINAGANAAIANAEREAAAAKIAAQIAAQGNKTAALKNLLGSQSQSADISYKNYQAQFKTESQIYNAALKKAVDEALDDARKKMPAIPLEGGGYRLRTKEDMEQYRGEYARRVRNSDAFKSDLLRNADYQAAMKRTNEWRGIYLGDQAGVYKLKGAIADSEAKAKELAKQKEIDKIKEQAAVQAEKNIQVELGKVRLEAAKKQSLAEANARFQVANAQGQDAQARLAAAQSAVQRAWGWYRNKDSMKAQLDEEKANAEAERQYEKDFAKLSWRRDWRTAKNLSVDQEATRRVALAKEEEAAAKKAVAETAANTKRAADAVEEIAKTMEEAGNVD